MADDDSAKELLDRKICRDSEVPDGDDMNGGRLVIDLGVADDGDFQAPEDPCSAAIPQDPHNPAAPPAQIKMKFKRKNNHTNHSNSCELVSAEFTHHAIKQPTKHPLFSGKRPKKRNPSVMNVNNLAVKKQRKSLDISQEVVEKRETGTIVRSVSSSTDADLLGPCEPGTHVCLEGCVFHENDAGMLVVNVTWRRKSYVGTLLDSSRFHWAPPRGCGSPAPDGESGGGKTPLKNKNGKRGGRLAHSSSNADFRAARQAANGAKSTKPKLVSLSVSVDEDSNSKTNGEEKGKTVSESILQPMSPILRECPCANCEKRFSGQIGLKFHQNANHRRKRSSSAEEQEAEQEIELKAEKPDQPPETGDKDSELGELNSEQKESLQQLFAGVMKNALPAETANTAQLPKPIPATTDIPTLEPSERSVSRSPAYSDISDDGAPVLEKEGEAASIHKTPRKTTPSGKIHRTSPPKSGSTADSVEKKMEIDGGVNAVDKNLSAPPAHSLITTGSDLKIATEPLNQTLPIVLGPSAKLPTTPETTIAGPASDIKQKLVFASPDVSLLRAGLAKSTSPINLVPPKPVSIAPSAPTIGDQKVSAQLQKSEHVLTASSGSIYSPAASLPPVPVSFPNDKRFGNPIPVVASSPFTVSPHPAPFHNAGHFVASPAYAPFMQRTTPFQIPTLCFGIPRTGTVTAFLPGYPPR